jgi:uncharacterized heparinase superfamily protein
MLPLKRFMRHQLGSLAAAGGERVCSRTLSSGLSQRDRAGWMPVTATYAEHNPHPKGEVCCSTHHG